MMKKWLFSFCFGITSFGFSQDLHFSQISHTPLLINPALTGVMDGWERVSILQRNQWVGSNGKYNSTLASVDLNLMKSEMLNNGYLGLGVLFFNDVAGDGKIGQQSGSISLNGILPMGNTGHTLAAGLQGGFGSSTVLSQALTFENQWNGEEFDPTVLSNEKLNNHFSYADVSAGVLYQFDGSSTSFFGKSESKLQLGISAYHFNRPVMKFVTGGEGILNRKFVFHGLFQKDIKNSKAQLQFDFAQFIQGKQLQTIYGGKIKVNLNKSGNYFGNNSQFGVGMHLRSFNALIPSAFVLWRGFQLSISYDATLSTLRKTQGGGSFEIGLSYTNLQSALFKSRRKLR